MANKNTYRLQWKWSLLSLISINAFVAAQDDVDIPASVKTYYENPIVIKEPIDDQFFYKQDQETFDTPDSTLNFTAMIQQAGYKIINEDEDYIYAEATTKAIHPNTLELANAEREDQNFEEGMQLTRNKRALVIRPGSSRERRWPHDGQIPYYLHPDLPETQKNTFRRAATHYNVNTNLYVFELKDDHKSRTRARFPIHVLVKPNSDSYSMASTGRRRHGANYIELAVNAGISTMRHEIGHVAGLTHEQKRSDRDQYIDVHRAHIESGEYSQFEKTGSDYLAVGAYDYQSIMHYGRYNFSKDGSPTITAKQNQSLSGDQLSEGDILALNLMYPVDGVCPAQYFRKETKRKYKRFLGIMISKKKKTVTWCDI